MSLAGVLTAEQPKGEMKLTTPRSSSALLRDCKPVGGIACGMVRMVPDWNKNDAADEGVGRAPEHLSSILEAFVVGPGVQVTSVVLSSEDALNPRNFLVRLALFIAHNETFS
ncbi:hypothetical protein N658DRAFT_32677 [Parathielavia hyrcaniae]|uniref:Uncharacterized protein n=1 Tax=Parathielavia hyrcaniae TaxID=113614 RepID=A0AAN6QC53_9PEZI|nr:hypothetical protein N658DRAFT_32677 [Parathielavia hyrcaniae]